MYLDKLIVFAQSGSIRANVVVIGQTWLYSGKSCIIQAKVVVFKKNGCIRARMVVFEQSGCNRTKVVIF